MLDRVRERDSNIPSSGEGIFPSSAGLQQDTCEAGGEKLEVSVSEI